MDKILDLSIRVEEMAGSIQNIKDIIDQVKGFTMRDVKAQIELGKQEVMSEVRENMNFIKEIQGEFSVLRSKLDNIN